MATVDLTGNGSLSGNKEQQGLVARTMDAGTLNRDTDTTQGQLDSLLAKGSPLIERARSRAAQSANDRGLLNSTMAVQAGEAAAYDAALPIASADANANLSKDLQQGDIAGQLQVQAADIAGKKELQTADSQNQIALQQLRGQQSEQLAQIEAGFKTLMQANDSASRFFSQMSSSISDILKEPNIPVDQKGQLIQKQKELLQNGMAVIGAIGNLDLSGLLDFTGTMAPPAA